MYSVPGRTSCRIYFGWYNASPKPTSEFFNARTLTSIVGHAALLTKGSNERLSSSVVFRHLSVYYSITSTWNYKDSAARGDMNNNRACSQHQLSDAHAHTITKNGLPFFGKFIHSKQLHNFCNCIRLKHNHYNLSKTSHQPVPAQCLHSESAATPYRQYTPPSVHRCVFHMLHNQLKKKMETTNTCM